jgi:hypothetical protein
MKLAIRIALLLTTLLLGGCGASLSAPQTYELPSVRKIKLGINKMTFEKGDPALILNYETEIPIENVGQLREEANEVWTIFRNDVEAAGLNTAILRAAKNENSGFIRTGKVYGFLIERHDDGRWHWSDDKAK